MAKEITQHRRDDFEYLEDDDQIVEFLDLAASYIGRIVIELNSLEDNISFQIKELMGSTEYQDDMVFVFLADMSYSKKVFVLIKLYGQIIDGMSLDLRSQLSDLEQELLEAGRRRNQYAHANWTDVGTNGMILTKIKAKSTGVYHTYRKFDEEVMREDLQFISTAHENLDFFEGEFEDARNAHEKRIHDKK